MKMAIDCSRGPKRYLIAGVLALALLMGATGVASADPDHDDRRGHARNEHRQGHERYEHQRGHDRHDRDDRRGHDRGERDD